MDLPRGRRTQVKKSWKFQGMGESREVCGMENPGGWRSNGKKPLCEAGMNIFWNHSMTVSKCFTV